MKNIFLLLFLSSALTQTGFAQEPSDGEPAGSTTSPAEATPRSLSNWALGLSVLQWNETLKIQQAITNDKDVANFNALILALHRETTYYRWGWNFGAFIGSGRAVGGGNSTLISYEKDKVPFTVYGVSPRVFYRLSGRINAGVTGLALMKNIEWPKDNNSQSIVSGNNPSVLAVLDLNIRLFQKLDFYSGIGPLTDGTTLWKIGMNYRF